MSGTVSLFEIRRNSTQTKRLRCWLVFRSFNGASSSASWPISRYYPDI